MTLDHNASLREADPLVAHLVVGPGRLGRGMPDLGPVLELEALHRADRLRPSRLG